jgi:integrase/recombinase XerD
MNEPMDAFSDDPLINRWLNQMTHNRGLALATVRRYGRFLDRLAIWLATLTPPCTVLNADTEKLERWTGFELHKAKLRPQTRKVAVAAVKGFYSWLAKVEILKTNPSDSLPSPKVGYGLPRPAHLEHAQSLVMAPNIGTFIGLRDAAMLAILIGTGCRVSGLVGLNESDLIWGKNKKGTERLKIRFVEKGQKERIFPAPLEVGLLIRAYLGHEATDREDRTLPNGDRVLFVNRNNPTVPAHERYGEKLRIRADSFADILRKYGKEQGIPNVVLHPHAFRHLFGVELAESDVDLLIRQTLLGHSKPETTGIYTQLAVQKLWEIVDKSNPLGKIRTCVTDIANEIRRKEAERRRNE